MRSGDHHGASESSPLLGQQQEAPPSPTNPRAEEENRTDDVRPITPVSVKSSIRFPFLRKPVTRRQAVAAIFILLLIATSIALPLVYFLYIPHRLHEALSDGHADFRSLHIIAVKPEGVQVRVQALSRNDPVPPVDVTLQSTLVSVLAGDRRIAALQFPGISVPRGSSEVEVDFEALLGHIDTKFFSKLVRKGVTSIPHQTLRILASPMLSLRGIGSWVVPVEQFATVDHGTLPPLNGTQYNVTLVDQSATPISFTQYRLSAVLAFSNPHPVSFAPQLFSLCFSIYYEDQRVIDVALPSTTHLVQGRNVNATVKGLTVAGGFTLLMKLVGEYAAGNASDVTVSGFSLAYEDDDVERLDWLETILRELTFDVEVPGASGDDDDEDGEGVWMAGLVGSVVRIATQTFVKANSKGGFVEKVKGMVRRTPFRI
ncbi:hypothetical protein HKX48_008237 [Thoreauomyces humboldtii]|nr:hypothetical protein HKX48_008237 [Thoreauomyces humboldtii]